MMTMLQILLDLLFPRRSLTGGEGEFITESELRSLRSAPVILETSQLRLQKLEWIDRIVAAAHYDAAPLLHRAIHTFKYRGVRGMGEALGDILVAASHASSFLPPDRNEGEVNASPVLCPVPLHWIRKFSRGFNQAEILARAVGKKRGWEMRELLRRTRWTGSQVGRKRVERLQGVRSAFAMERRRKSGQEIPECVILVDDLSTTGATLDACAKELKKSGTKRVEGLVIALG